MNVTSLELSKELYEMSGWIDRKELRWDYVVNKGELPRYDLGYLLRKLPYKTDLRQLRDGWSASYSNNSYRRYGDARRDAYGHANTPEDAVGGLCIELFKLGVLV